MSKVRQFRVHRGLDWTKRLKYKIGTQPVDISEIRFRMQVKETYEGAAVITIDSDNEEGVSIVDGPNGIFELFFTREQTALLLKDVYLFDLVKITNSEEEDEKRDFFFGGQLLMSDVVTTS